MHNTIRDLKRVREFEHRLRMGHILRGIETPIKISKIISKSPKYLKQGTNYYKYYIHDGHHRIYAAYLCGIKELMTCEYSIQDMSYAMYQDLAPQVGWVTPLDIRTHVRKPDFYAFKNEALVKYNNNEAWRQYVNDNTSMYLEPRVTSSVKGMIYE